MSALDATTLTIDEVRLAVDDIRQSAGDDEGAHSMEDTLHETVLEAIATGRFTLLDARTACRIALETRDIEFSRWCA